MKERKMKLITVAGVMLIATVIIGGLIFGPFNKLLPESLRRKLGYDTTTTGVITARLIVDFNGARVNVNTTITFQENETATAYSILIKANLTLKIKEYQQGIYIEGIEGVTQNATHFWWYQINGKDGTVAANRLDLRSYSAWLVSWIFRRY
ncbi:MAG: DUF4430 domain-containing protein [Candidatus Heimdallarchaeota archaeon]|nr:MAG: hypothetical protein DRP02_03820 [Candidatus Gerdarchaeota archaeon]RLI73087.1 MAG: hypothetical protein DRO91_03665 [Candidatus Heimdallarchaeota archaeon]